MKYEIQRNTCSVTIMRKSTICLCKIGIKKSSNRIRWLLRSRYGIIIAIFERGRQLFGRQFPPGETSLWYCSISDSSSSSIRRVAWEMWPIRLRFSLRSGHSLSIFFFCCFGKIENTFKMSSTDVELLSFLFWLKKNNNRLLTYQIRVHNICGSQNKKG